MSTHTPGPWSSSEQRGTPGHCLQAQIWDRDGKSLACIEPTEDAAEATANARIMAVAPELLAALEGMTSNPAYSGLIKKEHWQAAKAAIAKTKGE